MKLIRILGYIAFFALAVTVLVVNPQNVEVFYPTLQGQIASFELKLGVMLMLTLLAGFFAGTFIMWFMQHKHRRNANKAKKEVRKLQTELEKPAAPRTEPVRGNRAGTATVAPAASLPSPGKRGLPAAS